MSISSSFVGRRYRLAYPYEVSQAKITEFSRALGCLPGEENEPNPIAPPTMAAVIAAQAWELFFADAEADIALSRTIHGDQRFEFNAPLQAGDRILAVLEVEAVRARTAMEIITVRVDLHRLPAGVAGTAAPDDAVDPPGAIVARSWSTLVHRRPSTEEAA
ncbi:MAG: MaoC family dehydratase N-terminal domain-containing protein [Propionibacteriaceae bacterium]|jgi:hypothetical protein|nr:MaoC family dehydratase N-terminal domain-containing protein [Propionibacteriaceae bacterium]